MEPKKFSVVRCPVFHGIGSFFPPKPASIGKKGDVLRRKCDHALRQVCAD